MYLAKTAKSATSAFFGIFGELPSTKEDADTPLVLHALHGCDWCKLAFMDVIGANLLLWM